MRLLLDRPYVLAWIYVLASVLLGPVIFLGGYVFFTQGVGDYCDAIHGSVADRDAAFRSAQIFQVTGAGVMVAVGLVLLIRLWTHRARLPWYFSVVSGAAVEVMMAGFVLVILLSGPAGQSC
ncbi:hypothetical protein NONO_c04710 [Nocardia nova SH22a]|uniref:DUF998 domain-containing protein n=1 Tax=Nocardia nova SH22a TaxID=1415166 RepID=W5T814_9NOCA|nr:hypothetical protein [Nocardia nova]AHH15284.1 hypothetical protein NONO_c04710 [Nocardia nova SH22a]